MLKYETPWYIQWIYELQGRKEKKRKDKKNGACMNKQTKGELSGSLRVASNSFFFFYNHAPLLFFFKFFQPHSLPLFSFLFSKCRNLTFFSLCFFLFSNSCSQPLLIVLLASYSQGACCFLEPIEACRTWGLPPGKGT